VHFRQESVTDADDITSLPDLQPVTFGPRHKLEKQDSGFHTLSFKNHNFLPHCSVTKCTEDGHTEDQDQFCIQNSYLNMEYEQKAPCLSRDQDKTNNSQHACANLRRQNNYEGDAEENTSLLANGEVELALFPSLKSTSCDQTQMDGSDRELNSHSRQDNTVHSDMDTNTINNVGNCIQQEGAVAAGNSHETMSKNKMANEIPSIMKSHRLAKARADNLKRELARIQQELKSLGELELEVSYV
jgi:hypothetical protein